MCLKCHVASAKMPIKYGKYNADTKFYICIKDPSSWVHITLNQRVTGSSPVAPTNQFNNLANICMRTECVVCTRFADFVL